MLTKRQKQVYEFLNNFSFKKGVSPTHEEIAKKFNLAVSTIHEHISALEKKGYINKGHGQARAIETQNPNTELVRIPLLGSIAAGKPFQAVQENESIAVPKYKVTGGNVYALKVVGNSMIDEKINDGDIVLIRHQSTAENGQKIVALIDNNEVTLKRFFKEKGGIRLQPANKKIEPIIIRNGRDIKIQGIVIDIIKTFNFLQPGFDINYDNFFKPKSLKVKKEEFLNSIKGIGNSSSNKYKRVAVSPIRYAGGKSLAVGHVIEFLPDNVKKVVSPFFGGGSIEIAMSKYLDLEVVGYDIFDILCNYWKFQIGKPEILYKELKKLKPDKRTFEKIRLILNDVWKKKMKLDPLTLAVYNFNLSYGPGFMGWSSDIYLNENKYKRMIERIKDFAPKNLKVECADFRNIMREHRNDFLYCDPPYYIGKGSKMFRGIYPMRNIPVHHKGFPHEELRDLLKDHKGGFILSYNNCPTIKEYYKEFQHFFPSWQYTMGQGETRIGKNRIENGDNHIKDSHELIIFNPPIN